MYEELYENAMCNYYELEEQYEELECAYSLLKEEYEQQEEILDSIEDILRLYVPEELAEIIHNEIFQLG